VANKEPALSLSRQLAGLDSSYWAAVAVAAVAGLGTGWPPPPPPPPTGRCQGSVNHTPQAGCSAPECKIQPANCMDSLHGG